MKIESMRTRSYLSFKVDDADLPVEAREEPAPQKIHGRKCPVSSRFFACESALK